MGRRILFAMIFMSKQKNVSGKYALKNYKTSAQSCDAFHPFIMLSGRLEKHLSFGVVSNFPFFLFASVVVSVHISRA
jgi:hypothetical protein